ncbi:nucleotidyltransferase family protein [Streptomyces sp. NPDC053750]|uniref:nucleotidyltransferase family protein n=1 Tax=Streptomyces sp. NPDC053750 TaxID=3365714 RepID=UPI0037D771E2
MNIVPPAVEPFLRPLYATDDEAWPASDLPLDKAVLDALKETKSAYTVLQAWAARALPLGPEARAELDRLRTREAVLDRELAAASSCLTEAGVEHLLLRGHALGTRYPAGQVRQYNDVDLLIREGDALPSALTALRSLDYYTARPMVCRRDGAGLWAGVALNRRVEGLGHPMYLDLTTLGPGLDRASAVPLPADAWAGLRELPVGGALVPVLDTTWQAAVFAVELVEREGKFIFRDLLDLLALDRGGADWDAVVAALAGAPAAVVALAELHRIAQETGIPVRTARVPRPPSHGCGTAVSTRSRRAAVAALDHVIARLRGNNKARARRLVELFPVRPWFALGLPVFVLPPAADRQVSGGAVLRGVGLPDHRALVYPLVPPGYSRAAFAPPAEEHI